MSTPNESNRPSRGAPRMIACDGTNPANFGAVTGRRAVHIGLTTADAFTYAIGGQASSTSGIAVGAGFAPVVLYRDDVGDAIDDNISVFAAAGKVACVIEFIGGD